MDIPVNIKVDLLEVVKAWIKKTTATVDVINHRGSQAEIDAIQEICNVNSSIAEQISDSITTEELIEELYNLYPPQTIEEEIQKAINIDSIETIKADLKELLLDITYILGDNSYKEVLKVLQSVLKFKCTKLDDDLLITFNGE